MNWITRSVALTVIVCISFDHGYAGTQEPDHNLTTVVTQPPSSNQTPKPSGVTQPPGATQPPVVTKSPVVTQLPGVTLPPDPNQATNVTKPLTDPHASPAAPSGNHTDGNGNGGSGDTPPSPKSPGTNTTSSSTSKAHSASPVAANTNATNNQSTAGKATQAPRNNATTPGNPAPSQHLPEFITAILTTSVVLFGFIGQI